MNINIQPFAESITAKAGETITRTTTISNDGEQTVTGLTYEATPYSYYLNSSYDKIENFDTPWRNYNDVINWISIDGPYSLASGESATINYTITIPDCSPSDYQWMTLMINIPSDSTGIISRMAEPIDVTIEDNEASECGGTIDDVYPYVEIKWKSGSNSIASGLTGYDSNAAILYEENREELAELEATTEAKNQIVSTANDNLPLIIGVVTGALIFSALVILLVKLLGKKKSHPSVAPSVNPPANPPASSNSTTAPDSTKTPDSTSTPQ